MKRFEIFFGIVKIPVDLIMTILAFLLAYKLRLITEPIEGITKAIDYTVLPTLNQYLIFSAKAATLLIAIFALNKMYTLKSTSRFSDETKKTISLCGVWAMIIITYFFFTRTFPFSRLAIFYSWALTLILIIAGRAIVKMIQNGFLNLDIGRRKLIFIGNNNITTEINERLMNDPGYKILGVVGEANLKSRLKVRKY